MGFRIFGTAALQDITDTAEKSKQLSNELKNIKEAPTSLIAALESFSQDTLFTRATFMGYDLPNVNGDAINRMYAEAYGPAYIGVPANKDHSPKTDGVIGKVVMTYHREIPFSPAPGEKIIGKTLIPGFEGIEGARELQLKGITGINRKTLAGEDMARKVLAGEVKMVSQEADTEYCWCSACGHRMKSPQDPNVCAHLKPGSKMRASYPSSIPGDKLPFQVLAFRWHENPVPRAIAYVVRGAYSKADVDALVQGVLAGYNDPDVLLCKLEYEEAMYGESEERQAIRKSLEAAYTHRLTAAPQPTDKDLKNMAEKHRKDYEAAKASGDTDEASREQVRLRRVAKETMRRKEAAPLKASDLRKYKLTVDGKPYVATLEYEIYDGMPEWTVYEFKDSEGKTVSDEKTWDACNAAFDADADAGKVESALYNVKDEAVDMAYQDPELSVENYKTKEGVEARLHVVHKGLTILASYPLGALALGRDLTAKETLLGSERVLGEFLKSPLYAKRFLMAVRKNGWETTKASLDLAASLYAKKLKAAGGMSPEDGPLYKSGIKRDHEPASTANEITYDYFCTLGGLSNPRCQKVQHRNGSHTYETYHLTASIEAEDGGLRSVKVTFADGNTISTNMAKGLSDEEIKKYYAIGKEFNVGSGPDDNMQKVAKVEILDKLEASVQAGKSIKYEGYTIEPSGDNFVIRDPKGSYMEGGPLATVETCKKFIHIDINEQRNAKERRAKEGALQASDNYRVVFNSHTKKYGVFSKEGHNPLKEFDTQEEADKNKAWQEEHHNDSRTGHEGVVAAWPKFDPKKPIGPSNYGPNEATRLGSRLTPEEIEKLKSLEKPHIDENEVTSPPEQQGPIGELQQSGAGTLQSGVKAGEAKWVDRSTDTEDVFEYLAPAGNGIGQVRHWKPEMENGKKVSWSDQWQWSIKRGTQNYTGKAKSKKDAMLLVEDPDKNKGLEVKASVKAAPSFDKWLDTFISEKGIDLEDTFDVEGPSGTNTMPYGVIIEHMKIAGPQEQKALKNKMIYLDFKNADIKDFLRHLGGAIAAGVVSDASIMGSFKKTLKASVKSAAPHYHGDMQHTHEGLPGTVSDEEGHSHGNPSDVKFKTDIPSSTKKRVGDDAPGGKVRALNSVDVVGYAKDGALYCPACAAKWGVPLDGESAREAEINAVFADDAQPGDSCDTCGEYLHGAEPEGVNASITKNTKVRLKATKNPETDYFSNFKKMDGEGTAYKHNQSGEVIYKNNGTWRVIRKDKSKGSLGNGEDMYHPENLNLAMKDVHERMKGGVEATAPTLEEFKSRLKNLVENPLPAWAPKWSLKQRKSKVATLEDIIKEMEAEGAKAPVQAAITTDKELDDALAQFCKQEGFSCPKDPNSPEWAGIMDKFKKYHVSDSLKSSSLFEIFEGGPTDAHRFFVREWKDGSQGPGKVWKEDFATWEDADKARNDYEANRVLAAAPAVTDKTNTTDKSVTSHEVKVYLPKDDTEAMDSLREWCVKNDIQVAQQDLPYVCEVGVSFLDTPDKADNPLEAEFMQLAQSLGAKVKKGGESLPVEAKVQAALEHFAQSSFSGFLRASFEVVGWDRQGYLDPKSYVFGSLPETSQIKASETKEAKAWISKKIGKLVNEGKPQAQAVAIAHSMARKDGFKVPENPNLKSSVFAVPGTDRVRITLPASVMAMVAGDSLPPSPGDDRHFQAWKVEKTLKAAKFEAAPCGFTVCLSDAAAVQASEDLIAWMTPGAYAYDPEYQAYLKAQETEADRLMMDFSEAEQEIADMRQGEEIDRKFDEAHKAELLEAVKASAGDKKYGQDVHDQIEAENYHFLNELLKEIGAFEVGVKAAAGDFPGPGYTGAENMGEYGGNNIMSNACKTCGDGPIPENKKYCPKCEPKVTAGSQSTEDGQGGEKPMPGKSSTREGDDSDYVAVYANAGIKASAPKTFRRGQRIKSSKHGFGTILASGKAGVVADFDRLNGSQWLVLEAEETQELEAVEAKKVESAPMERPGTCASCYSTMHAGQLAASKGGMHFCSLCATVERGNLDVQAGIVSKMMAEAFNGAPYRPRGLSGTIRIPLAAGNLDIVATPQFRGFQYGSRFYAVRAPFPSAWAGSLTAMGTVKGGLKGFLEALDASPAYQVIPVASVKSFIRADFPMEEDDVDATGDEGDTEEIGEEDITIGEDDLTAYYLGKQIVSVDREEADEDPDALYKAINAWMEKNKYWPDVWTVSDHGNINNVTAEVSKFQVKEDKKKPKGKVTASEEDEKKWWTSSSGDIELEMTEDQASSGNHSGRCDEDIEALSKVPEIATQLAALDPETVKKVLKEVGADWDDEELQDPKTNLERLLWIACGDIMEESYQNKKNAPKPSEDEVKASILESILEARLEGAPESVLSALDSLKAGIEAKQASKLIASRARMVLSMIHGLKPLRASLRASMRLVADLGFAEMGPLHKEVDTAVHSRFGMSMDELGELLKEEDVEAPDSNDLEDLVESYGGVDGYMTYLKDLMVEHGYSIDVAASVSAGTLLNQPLRKTSDSLSPGQGNVKYENLPGPGMQGPDPDPETLEHDRLWDGTLMLNEKQANTMNYTKTTGSGFMH